MRNGWGRRRQPSAWESLYAILDEGDLPSYKLRRVIRLKTADVEAYRELADRLQSYAAGGNPAAEPVV